MNKKNIFFLAVIVLIILAVMAYAVFSGISKKENTTSRIYRIGILSGLEYFSGVMDGFKEKMEEFGYIQGQNTAYDIQKTDFDILAYQNILDRFITERVDLILVFPTEASQEAKKATEGTGIPVIFAAANIEGTELVDSVRFPGENITGVRYPGPDIALQRLEIMHELIPNAKNILIPYQRGYPIIQSQLEVLYPVAEEMGISIEELPADGATELEEIFSLRGDDKRIDAILFLAEPLAVTPENFVVIARFAKEYNIPVCGAAISVGEYKSIFGVSINNKNTGAQSAVLADKILRGADPGVLPVVSAESHFQLNYSAAEEIGLTVSDGLLNRANEVIR